MRKNSILGKDLSVDAGVCIGNRFELLNTRGVCFRWNRQSKKRLELSEGSPIASSSVCLGNVLMFWPIWTVEGFVHCRRASHDLCEALLQCRQVAYLLLSTLLRKSLTTSRYFSGASR